jgi:hypothetical protein
VRREGLAVRDDSNAQHVFLTSGDVTTFRKLGVRFLGPEVESVEAWTWS